MAIWKGNENEATL